MLPSIQSIYDTLAKHNIHPQGVITHGIKRHNDSATDGKSIFVKMLGESNSIESFHRELAAAKMFPFAPQPIIDEVARIKSDSSDNLIPATLWEFINGQEIDVARISEKQILHLMDTLFRVYKFPLEEVTVPLSRINADAIKRRMVKASPQMPVNLRKDVEKLINFMGLNIEELLAQHSYTEVIAHGDPHIGNILQVDENTVKLIDYESIKITPIEFDLACIFQSLVQFHDNEKIYNVAKSDFAERKIDYLGSPINEKLLDLCISFRNISSTTYLISFENWELIDNRVQSLLPMLKGASYPERIKLEVDWLE
jgi:hypothetical protein